MIPKVIYVLLVLVTSTRDQQWTPMDAATSLQECRQLATPERLLSAKDIGTPGNLAPWKCVRFKRD